MVARGTCECCHVGVSIPFSSVCISDVGYCREKRWQKCGLDVAWAAPAPRWNEAFILRSLAAGNDLGAESGPSGVSPERLSCFI